MKIKNLSIICTVPDHPTQPRDHGPLCILKHLWSLLLAFKKHYGKCSIPILCFQNKAGKLFQYLLVLQGKLLRNLTRQARQLTGPAKIGKNSK